MSYSAELKSRLASALRAKGPDYKPRTRHIENGLPRYTNRLILEDSPYLLQHAHNPVDWFPWGEEAFSKATTENKPVFLSIGYATCHWCHVMEEDSFENIEVARLLNENFVAVKVDREQYPDVDQAYMTAVNLLTGQGGWPMSSFLTGQGKPFFCGTYYPSADFIDLLLNIKQGWQAQHQAIIEQAQRLANAVRQVTSAQQQLSNLELEAVSAAISSIMSNYDRKYGGFSEAPKFPYESLLLLLLQVLERQPDVQLSVPLVHTLSAMSQGGIYDQVGGGFHRYAVDNAWLIPHFEKMLYNQAYLSRVYAQAFRLTGNPLFARIARHTLDYVLREMTSTDGVFFSATDADSDGQEGRFFVWTEDEIKHVLDTKDAEFFCKLFGVTAMGNFEGKNILYLPEALDKLAGQQGMALDLLLARIEPLLEKLRNYRKQRTPPLTDNKIIVAWNGMLITALAEAGDLLDESRYINAAAKAADFLWRTQRPEQGLLWRVFLDGKSSIIARQEDYAHFVEALLTLYDVCGEPVRLEQAGALCDEMLDKFMDSSCNTLVMGRDKLLFTHPTEAYDGALPSGNAVAVRVLGRLARRSGKKLYHDYAEKIVRAFSGSLIKQPAAYAYMLAQVEEMKRGETGLRHYAVQGAIKIKAVPRKTGDSIAVELNLVLAGGWHIVAPSAMDVEPSTLQIRLEDENDWSLHAVAYPEAVTIAIEGEPKRGYQGSIQIVGRLSPKTAQAAFPVKMALQLQACNDKVCLAAETIRFRLYQADC